MVGRTIRQGLWRQGSVYQNLTLLRRLPAEVLAEVEVEKDPVKLKRLTLRRLLGVAQLKGQGERRRRLRSLMI